MPTILPVTGIKGTFVDFASRVQQGRETVKEQEPSHLGENSNRVPASGHLGEGHMVTRGSGLNVKELGWAQS